MPNDIFISYAHIDNQPLGDTSGWVDQLFKHLQVRLSRSQECADEEPLARLQDCEDTPVAEQQLPEELRERGG